MKKKKSMDPLKSLSIAGGVGIGAMGLAAGSAGGLMGMAVGGVVGYGIGRVVFSGGEVLKNKRGFF